MLDSIKSSLSEKANGMFSLTRVAVISKASQGMFLWVHLVLLDLETVHSIQELTEVLEAIPTGLPDL